MPNALTKVTGNVIDSATNITIGIGSTSGPSLSPNGDSNTGIFFPSADTIAFAEGGIEVARIDSSGNLGIGSAIPGSKLDVQGTGAFTAASSNSSTITAPIYANSPLQTISAFFGRNDSTSALTANQYSTAIRFNGSGVAWGDISYYPNQGGQGHFRFSTTGSTVGTTPNAIVGAAGIAFPATQSASTNANTLDDYEEGTWTASIATESGTAWTVTTQNSTYIKIGRLVFIHALINYTAKGSGQLSLVQSLPFTSTSEVTLYGYNYRSSDNTLRALLFTAYSNYGVLLKWIDSGSFVNYFTSTTDFAAAGIIYVAGCYLAAS